MPIIFMLLGMIVSLDMHHMNAIKHVNRHNMTAVIEAGAVSISMQMRIACMSSCILISHLLSHPMLYHMSSHLIQ